MITVKETRLTSTTCSHLDQTSVTALPEPIVGCEECLKIGSEVGFVLTTEEAR